MDHDDMGKKVLWEISFDNCGSTIQRDRLLGYYTKLQNEDGKELSDKKKDVLKRIAYSLSEDDAKIQSDRIEAMAKRLMAYSKMLSEHLEGKELQKVKNTVNDLLDAYEDYDFYDENAVEINGNKFTYNSEQFDIEKYKGHLASLGEESKGNSWYVDIDEFGEVVLHW